MSSRPRFVFFRRARFRLTLYYTLIMLVFMVVLCWFLYHRTDVSLQKQLDKFLRDEAQDIMAYAYAHPTPGETGTQAGPDHTYFNKLAIQLTFDKVSKGERFYEVSFRLFDREGDLIASSRVFRDEVIKPLSPEVLRLARDGETNYEYLQLGDRPSQHLLVTRPFDDQQTGTLQYILQTLAYLEPLDRLKEHFRSNIYSAFPVFLLISWFGGYALARKVLKPVHQISRTARRITSTKLGERLARAYSGDEIDQLAETLNDMIQRLQQSFALLTQFAADAAHELRTPLTILKGEAEIALRGNAHDPETYRATLERIIPECDRMIGIITHLLFLSQADSGGIRLGHEALRLDQILSEIAETFQILAEEAGLSLEAGDFPEIVVRGDRSRLHELFANLLDNACKYTPAGGRIALSCELGAEEVRVAVSDTGIGIPEGEREKIFDRFYRVDHSRSRETGGSGLGLSIVRLIAQAHGGRVVVQSVLGTGSTFTVVLPLASARRPGDAEAEEASTADANA